MDPTGGGPMDDDQAGRCVDAALNLALMLRDEGPDAVRRAALELLLAAGDPVAAVSIVAALVRVDEPVDCWWDTQAPPKPAPPSVPRLLPTDRPLDSYYGPAPQAVLEELIDALCPIPPQRRARRSA